MRVAPAVVARSLSYVLLAVVLASVAGIRPAEAQLGGKRLHVTAVTTGLQPDGNPIDVTLDCAPPLLFPPAPMQFFGPGDQDLNAQGMTQCSLVVPKPKDALTLTVRCVASGSATCLSDRSVRGDGEYLVTFTIIAAFPETPLPTTTVSLAPAVPTSAPGAGDPPTTTSGAPLPTNPTNVADPANPAVSSRAGDPAAPPNQGGTSGTGPVIGPNGAGGTGGAGGSGATAVGTVVPPGATAAGTASLGATAPNAAGSASGEAGSRSSVLYLAILGIVLALVAVGALAGASWRRRLTPVGSPPNPSASQSAHQPSSLAPAPSASPSSSSPPAAAPGTAMLTPPHEPGEAP